MDEEQEQLNQKGFTHFAEKEFEAAIGAFRASYAIAPNAQALHGIGECYAGLGQHQEAILYLAASVGIRPNPRASFELAESLFRCGHLREAG